MLPVKRLNESYTFIDVWWDAHENFKLLDDPSYLIFALPVRVLAFWYRFFTVPQLRTLCVRHGLLISGLKHNELLNKLLKHECSQACSSTKYIFKVLKSERRYVARVFDTSTYSEEPPLQSAILETADSAPMNDPVLMGENIVPEDISHLDPPSLELKEAIIKEWQSELSTAALKRFVCAVCSVSVTSDESYMVHPTAIDLSLLQNEDIPAHVPRPTRYNFELYKRAFLDTRGMENCVALGNFRACKSCKHALDNGAMPKFALSNWLYYALDCLPEPISSDLKKSSVFEHTLYARARANAVCCRFNARDSEDNGRTLNNNALLNARRGMRGNVMVAPLDVVKLSNVLPPSPDSVRETLCAIFVGRSMPSYTTIHKMKPILVNSSRVKRVIAFLLENNSHYKVSSDLQMSEANLASLLPEGVQEGVPQAAHIDFVPVSEAIQTAMSDYAPRYSVSEDDTVWSAEDILMENVGYTDGDDTPASYHNMTETALKHCLKGKPFVASRAGSSPVDDFHNPSLMSWLFPHLDPWGIGGFHVPKRRVKISMEEQVKHLLSIFDSPFMRDSQFPFVCYNIVRKKHIASSLRFTIPLSSHRHVLSELSSIDPQVFLDLNRICKENPRFVPQTDEHKRAYKVLHILRLMSSHVPGSDGYKLMLRNWIRALIYELGTPTFFVTLNPSDVDNPIVRLFVGEDIDLERLPLGESLTSWQRKMTAAKNPAACAMMFDMLIKKFIRVILRHDRPGRGLYGKCRSYFGTVEAQGKGTLHCHMLVWLEGHVSPQTLRDGMAHSPDYQAAVIKWLDSVISTGFPTSSDKNEAQSDRTQRLRHTDFGDQHPGTFLSPILTHDREKFWRDFREDVTRLLYEYSWHEHQPTCWKYLARGQEKSSANCRLRMDSVTRAKTVIDPETFGILLRRSHPWIAAHTDIVTFLMRCNMDIKFVGSGDAAKAFLYYVTDYITKPSLSVHAGMAALTYAIKKVNEKTVAGNDVSPLSAVITAVNSMMGRHEISHPQVLSYLIGGGDHYTPATFSVLHWGHILRRVKVDVEQFDRRNTMDTAPEETVSLDFSTESPTVHSQYNDYVYRSEEILYESLCLYDFVALTQKKLHKPKEGDISTREGCFVGEQHPQRDTHFLTMRSRPRTPVVIGPSFHNPTASSESRNSWCMEMLVLFKPWREPGDLKMQMGTYTEAYEAYYQNFSDSHKRIIKNINIFRECRDARSVDKESIPRQLDYVGANESEDDLYPISIDLSEYALVEETDRVTTSDDASELKELLGSETAGLLEMCLSTPDSITEALPEPTPAKTPTVITAAENATAQSLAALIAMSRKRRLAELDDIADEPAPTKRQRMNAPVPLPPDVQLSTIGNSGSTSTHVQNSDIVQQVINEFNLSSNKEQLAAFSTVADHVQGNGDGRQLLMLVSGVGGTGKSHVIKAIVRLFQLLTITQDLRIGAPTGIAASLIGGQTLHSLIISTPSGKGQNKKRLVNMWKGVRYLIIDEVSMIGAYFLSTFSSRLREAKGDNSAASSMAFGGLNVIFFGDMAQLKPPAQCSLYDSELVSNQAARQSKDPNTISSLNGVLLWRTVNKVITLTKNQRHSGDPGFSNLLSRLRIGGCDSYNRLSGVRDVDIIRGRMLSSLAYNPALLQEFSDAPVIVGTKVIRDAVNRRLIQYHSSKAGVESSAYHSRDSVSSAPVSNVLRHKLWDLPSNVTKDSFGKLPMFVGMKVMVTENVAFDLGIVNGCEGIVYDIKYKIEDTLRFLAVVYVKFEGFHFGFDGLPDDVAPIFPVSSYISHKPLAVYGIPRGTFNRKQVPLVPAYAYTDFKSQGRTLKKAVVDLASARGQGIYVMLSRVTKLDGLAVLRWFPPSKINSSLSQELREELRRIDSIRAQTTGESDT